MRRLLIDAVKALTAFEPPLERLPFPLLLVVLARLKLARVILAIVQTVDGLHE